MTARERSRTRRAPRLGPDERIAALFTRSGRFLSVDPARPRPLPPVSHVVGSLAWAVFLAEAFRRARRASHASSP